MIKKLGRAILAAFASGALAVPSIVSADDGGKTVRGPEPGKCIFSTEVMPKDKFSHRSYSKVKDLFKPTDPIAVRCFYEGGAQSNFAKLGRVANTMRDSATFFSELEWINTTGGGSFSDFRIVAYKQSYNAGWTSQRFDLTSHHAVCDFKLKGQKAREYGAHSDGCVNYQRFMETAGKKYGRNPTGPQEFCVRLFVRFANASQWRTVGNERRYEPDYVEKTMARGCFKIDFDGIAHVVPAQGAPELAANGLSNRVEPEMAQVLVDLGTACIDLPIGGTETCGCFSEMAQAKGLPGFSDTAARLWIMNALNPGAFSQEQKMAVMARASAKDRRDAIGPTVGNWGGDIVARCRTAKMS
ncbi:MAG: hypothetical protein AAF251_07160 [Pseudomonadota bacterium]